MLPEFTLTLNGTLKGSEDEVVESLKIKYPDFHVGLELRIPSLHQGEKSKIEKADVQFEQLEHIIKDLQITLESNLPILAMPPVTRASISSKGPSWMSCLKNEQTGSGK
jgi:hypothetical protein